MKNILFVCTGNTCRSCMAEGFLKEIIDNDEVLKKNIKVSSVGVYVQVQSRASNNSINVLKDEWDIDISGHMSRQLSKKDVEQAQIILTMTNSHKQMLLDKYNSQKEKIFTLKEYITKYGETQKDLKGDLDIIDPFGGTYQQYRLCAQEIRQCIEELKKILLLKYKQQEDKNLRGELMIGLGCDHAGIRLKDEIIKYLKERDLEFKDYGTFTLDSVDYSDYALKVAHGIKSGECDRGIVICGTGIGISIAANKVRGIRAALCTDAYMAKMSRRHNDSNILALGDRVIGVGEALDIVEAWLNTEFEGGRHQRRLDKITDIENL